MVYLGRIRVQDHNHGLAYGESGGVGCNMMDGWIPLSVSIFRERERIHDDGPVLDSQQRRLRA